LITSAEVKNCLSAFVLGLFDGVHARKKK
jgi:hypothetical protein